MGFGLFAFVGILLSVYVVQNENIDGGLKGGYFVGLVVVGLLAFVFSL